VLRMLLVHQIPPGMEAIPCNLPGIFHIGLEYAYLGLLPIASIRLRLRTKRISRCIMNA
jgi:hypothetical protein